MKKKPQIMKMQPNLRHQQRNAREPPRRAALPRVRTSGRGLTAGSRRRLNRGALTSVESTGKGTSWQSDFLSDFTLQFCSFSYVEESLTLDNERYTTPKRPETSSSFGHFYSANGSSSSSIPTHVPAHGWSSAGLNGKASSQLQVESHTTFDLMSAFTPQAAVRSST